MSILKSAAAKVVLGSLAAVLALTAWTTGSRSPHLTAGPVRVSAATSEPGVTAEPLAARQYTMAQVKKHNKKSDCCTVIGSGVYKLTSFVKKHPGGQSRIVALRSKKGTAKFRAEHGTGGTANATLKKYKIGVLA